MSIRIYEGSNKPRGDVGISEIDNDAEVAVAEVERIKTFDDGTQMMIRKYLMHTYNLIKKYIIELHLLQHYFIVQ